MEVFFDLEINLSFFTIHGLSISTIHRSASFPIERLPLSEVVNEVDAIVELGIPGIMIFGIPLMLER